MITVSILLVTWCFFPTWLTRSWCGRRQERGCWHWKACELHMHVPTVITSSSSFPLKPRIWGFSIVGKSKSRSTWNQEQINSRSKGMSEFEEPANVEMGGHNYISSTTSSSNQRRRRSKECHCGVASSSATPLSTSYKSDNPGKKFYGCEFYKVSSSSSLC